jgi:hypothetical protein
VRFGGIAVKDSGSLATGLTGSLLWDSQNDVWIYSNPSGAAYDGGMLLTGPRNTSGLGNEVGITTNYLSKGDGSHHMTSSQISDNGTTVTIPGRLSVASGITGSLFGTSSWAINASQSISSSFATSASYAATAQNVLGSVTTAATASYAVNFTIEQKLTLDETLIDFAKVNSTIVGSNNLFQQATGSYRAAHCKYTLYKTTNARAGEFVTVWNGTTVTYYDNATTDIGSTTDIVLTSAIVSSQLQVNAVAASTAWTIKTIVTYI